MKVLVCNAGSSTLKFSLFEAEREKLLADGLIDWTLKPARLRLRRAGEAEVRAELTVGKHADAIARVLDDLRAAAARRSSDGRPDVQAVGHRIVHGGDRYSAAVRITPEVKRTI